jgi:tetratricopeptide (TPR) repeat protein
MRSVVACSRGIPSALAASIVVLWVVLFSWIASPSVRADSLFYDLQPLSETSPSVKRALVLLDRPSEELLQGDPEDVKAALRGLDSFAGSAPEKIDRTAAMWLKGSLLRHLGQNPESRLVFEALTKSSESIRDLAFVELYDLMEDSNQMRTSIERLLQVGPWVPQYAQHYKKAILYLMKAKDFHAAAEGVSKILDRSLSPGLRQALQRRLVELWTKIGQAGRSKALLMRTWWSAKSEAKRTKAWKKLRELGSKPSFYAQLARLVLQANRGNVKGIRKKLRMFKGMGTHQKRMYRWGQSLLNRFRSDLRPFTLRKMRRMHKHIPKKAKPYFLFGYALVLKSAKEPLKAAKLFHEIAEKFPEHHLAAEAALEVGRLLTHHGEQAEGMGAYQRAIEMAPRGAFHRAGLWRVGFTAHLAGEYKRAASMMGDIVSRYGGEREALGILWAEKAGYWQARSTELSGDVQLAALQYRRLKANFPMSWYGLWAQKRLEQLVVTGRARVQPEKPTKWGMKIYEAPFHELRIIQRPALDLAVMFLKLGHEIQARRSLSSMNLAGELPGSGRVLLSALYHRSGRSKRAQRLLKKSGIFVTSPGKNDQDFFSTMFPAEFRPLITTISSAYGLPTELSMGLVRIESRFNPRARSGAGATGLTQLMPKTARAVGRRLLGMKRVGRWLLRRPEPNLRIGLRYLKELLVHFKGHSPLALAGYNAGIGAVRSWWRKYPNSPSDVFVELIPYSQARNYVRRVFSIAHTYAKAFHPGRASMLPMHDAIPSSLGPYFEEK